jgi:acyl-CoA synthetase (AMP-forming)/AMP-acid ligase II
MAKNNPPRQAAQRQTADVSEAQIAVHWPKEDYFLPSNQFVAQANLTDPDIFARFSLDKVPECFKEFAEIANKVSASVVSEIGAIARPRQVIIIPDMPKTRSGKIMRRVLAAISNHQDPGDVSTLANPEVVEKIRELAK